MPNDVNNGSPLLCNQFYRKLGYNDEKIFTNAEHGIELYQGKHDRPSRPTEVSINFERAIGIFSTTYVRMVTEIIRQNESRLTPEQKLFVNFGALDLRVVNHPELVSIVQNEAVGKDTSDAYDIYYLSDWLTRVGSGSIVPTSEAAQSKSVGAEEEAEKRLKERRGKLESELDKLSEQEKTLFAEMSVMFERFNPDMPQEDKSPIIKAIKARTSRLDQIIKEQNQRFSDVESIKMKSKNSGDEIEKRSVEFSRMREEFETLKSVIRSCSVRGGLVKNTPVMIDKWVPMDTRFKINTRAEVDKDFSKLEGIDHTIFNDKKGSRRAPRILVVPGVGSGISWSDRMIISLFPPPTMRPEVSLARTFAGYRWYQATKSFNWKHLPGELGSMYQLIYPDKTFNHLEKSFLDDYTNWVTKESMGYQTLTAQVRKVFWKMIPFPTELKKQLSKRASVYGKLYADDLGKTK